MTTTLIDEKSISSCLISILRKLESIESKLIVLDTKKS